MNQFFMAKKSLPSGDRITGKKYKGGFANGGNERPV